MALKKEYMRKSSDVVSPSKLRVGDQFFFLSLLTLTSAR